MNGILAEEKGKEEGKVPAREDSSTTQATISKHLDSVPLHRLNSAIFLLSPAVSKARYHLLRQRLLADADHL